MVLGLDRIRSGKRRERRTTIIGSATVGPRHRLGRQSLKGFWY